MLLLLLPLLLIVMLVMLMMVRRLTLWSADRADWIKRADRPMIKSTDCQIVVLLLLLQTATTLGFMILYLCLSCQVTFACTIFIIVIVPVASFACSPVACSPVACSRCLFDRCLFSGCLSSDLGFITTKCEEDDCAEWAAPL